MFVDINRESQVKSKRSLVLIVDQEHDRRVSTLSAAWWSLLKVRLLFEDRLVPLGIYVTSCLGRLV